MAGAILDCLVERDERGNMHRYCKRVHHNGHVAIGDTDVIADVERVRWTQENGVGTFWRFFNETFESTDYFFSDADTAFHFKMRWK